MQPQSLSFFVIYLFFLVSALVFLRLCRLAGTSTIYCTYKIAESQIYYSVQCIWTLQ